MGEGGELAQNMGQRLERENASHAKDGGRKGPGMEGGAQEDGTEGWGVELEEEEWGSGRERGELSDWDGTRGVRRVGVTVWEWDRKWFKGYEEREGKGLTDADVGSKGGMGRQG